MNTIRVGGVQFYPTEIRDLLAAWAALGIAFSVFLFVSTGRSVFPNVAGAILSPVFFRMFTVSALTVGVGFLLHELAHKLIAVRFGQVASFKADYAMLALCIGAAFAGFLFAAPGAVYHRGRITLRERGLVSVAGPLTNVGLLVAFVPLLFVGGFLGEVGRLGIVINAFLAAFNMIPFGPLDGKTVLAWSKPIFAAVFIGSAALAAAAFLLVGVPSF